MSTKRSAGPSPEGIARSERQRAAAEEGARAMADAERQSFDVRKNMARLRELREAKELADATLRASLPPPAPKKRATKKSPR
ncbi:transcriptional regulator [Bradyrhizobium sp. A5]|uniref:transcriptional regulator n=1 Tax=Bradyrhizobium sp. A5 TaxID=3133696 RepID=UPI00324FEB77